jgi:hypothetical protein
MNVNNSVMTTVENDRIRWPIRDGSGLIVGHAASRETAAYIESSMRAVEVRVVSHAWARTDVLEAGG